MQEYTLRTVDNEGNVYNESKLVLNGKQTILIQHLPDVCYDEAQKIHELLEKSIEMGGDFKLISIPYGIKLQILDIE